MTEEQLGPPPVEPLSDVAWARLERGLWARMDGSVTVPTKSPSRRRWIWIAAPLVAVAATVVLVAVTRSSAIEGDLEVADLGGSDASDVRVVSPRNAPTSATFNDAYIELEPESAVVMRHDRPTTVLERGAATFAVAPRATRPPFVVLAGETTVRVIGTKFRVARGRNNDDRVAVEVEHGTVEVQFRGAIVRIHDHESWSSDHPRDIAAPTATAQEIEFEPTNARRPKPKKLEPDQDTDRAKFEHLAALENKDPKAAMTGYLELSQSSGRWAPNALYAAARLAADRNDARARTLLTVYLHRFPTGPNAEDARALLTRLP